MKLRLHQCHRQNDDYEYDSMPIKAELVYNNWSGDDLS